jgi:hypothetical protein
MNLRTVFKQMTANILAGNACVIKGPPGFGKTDLMGKVAMWLVQQNPGKRVGMSCFFMATQSPIGFTGLPWKGEREWEGKKWTVTDPAIPTWYMATDLDTGEVRPASLFDVVLLIIEEWGQGSAETKRAGAEVLRAGGTPPFYLPPGSPRIALTNVDASDGVTKEFDFIIGRRVELEVTGDVDVWVEDFADKPYQWQGKTWEVQPVTKAWAKQNAQILFEPKPPKQGPWCNPRTVTAADRYVQVITEMNGGVTPLNDSGFVETLAGQCGMGMATSYVGHLQFQLELPSYEDVVKDPMATPVPGKADLQMLMAYTLASRCKVEHLAEVIQYMTKPRQGTAAGMPKDMAVTFISSLLRRDYKAIINEPAMKAWISKNASLVSIIASLSQ